jgi:hypothetical protein
MHITAAFLLNLKFVMKPAGGDLSASTTNDNLVINQLQKEERLRNADNRQV